MKYYTSNAIYKKIAEKKLNSFYWVAKDAWILVYADNQYIPKAIVLAYNNFWLRDESIVKLTYEIAQRSGIPMIQVLFNSSQNEISSVDIAKYNEPFEKVSLDSLTDVFNGFGLPVNKKATSKAINSAESSAYHSWQRNNLGQNIVVVDIDLMKVNDKDLITVLELKRSFYDIDSWSPYTNDYPNFYVLENLCSMSKSNFYIVYNQRLTKPKFFDDASHVSVFSFNSGRPEKFGKYSFDELFNDN